MHAFHIAVSAPNGTDLKAKPQALHELECNRDCPSGSLLTEPIAILLGFSTYGGS